MPEKNLEYLNLFELEKQIYTSSDQERFYYIDLYNKILAHRRKRTLSEISQLNSDKGSLQGVSHD